MNDRRQVIRRVGFVVAMCLLSACDADRRPPPTPSLPAVDRTYVALGAPSAFGTERQPGREVWTQQFFREALPLGTVFYDLGTSGANVQATIDQQLPEALRLEPDVATVWLEPGDVISGLPADVYERLLGDLLRQLRRGGQTTVLVSNLPPLGSALRRAAFSRCVNDAFRELNGRVPSEAISGAINGRSTDPRAAPITRCVTARDAPLTAEESGGTTVAVYNAAVARAATTEGAVLVDLQAASTSSASGRDLVVTPGVGGSAIDHDRVNEAFASAAKRAGTEAVES